MGGDEEAESRVRGWSDRRDQVGRWGQRHVGGDEEVESRQQEAGCGDVGQRDESEKGGGTTPTFIGLAARGGGPPRSEASSPESGTPIGPDPSRGPLTLAENRNTSFPARSSQTAKIFRSDPTT